MVVRVWGIIIGAVFLLTIGIVRNDGPAFNLHEMSVGQTVYADLWEENGPSNDRSLLEQGQNELWRVPDDVVVSKERTPDTNVSITLTPDGTYVVRGIEETTKVGRTDRPVGDDYTYVTVEIPPEQLWFEEEARQ